MIYRINVDDISNAGVTSKMFGQHQALSKNHIVDIVYLNEESILLNQESIYSLKRNWSRSKAKAFYLYYKIFYSVLSKTLNLENYDLVYVRYHSTYPSLLRFLEKCLSKIVIEIPSFPYDQEFRSLTQRIQLQIDKWCRGHLKDTVNKIVHFGPHKSIFGIPTIQMTNGISIPNEKRLATHTKSDALHMIAIGKWQYWHGLDRVIQGLYSFKEKKKVFLHIIGEGPFLNNYKRLVSELNVEENVEFHGSLTGDKLFNLIHQTHIGIGSLAHHRKGLSEVSALKHRTYCMYGLPFVLASYDLDFPSSLGLSYEVPADDSPVEIEKVIEFYEQLETNFANRLYTYAKDHLSWDKKMTQLVEKVL